MLKFENGTCFKCASAVNVLASKDAEQILKKVSGYVNLKGLDDLQVCVTCYSMIVQMDNMISPKRARYYKNTCTVCNGKKHLIDRTQLDWTFQSNVAHYFLKYSKFGDIVCAICVLAINTWSSLLLFKEDKSNELSDNTPAVKKTATRSIGLQLNHLKTLRAQRQRSAAMKHLKDTKLLDNIPYVYLCKYDKAAKIEVTHLSPKLERDPFVLMASTPLTRDNMVVINFDHSDGIYSDNSSEGTSAPQLCVPPKVGKIDQDEDVKKTVDSNGYSCSVCAMELVTTMDWHSHTLNHMNHLRKPVVNLKRTNFEKYIRKQASPVNIDDIINKYVSDNNDDSDKCVESKSAESMIVNIGSPSSTEGCESDETTQMSINEEDVGESTEQIDAVDGSDATSEVEKIAAESDQCETKNDDTTTSYNGKSPAEIPHVDVEADTESAEPVEFSETHDSAEPSPTANPNESEEICENYSDDATELIALSDANCDPVNPQTFANTDDNFIKPEATCNSAEPVNSFKSGDDFTNEDSSTVVITDEVNLSELDKKNDVDDAASVHSDHVLESDVFKENEQCSSEIDIVREQVGDVIETESSIMTDDLSIISDDAKENSNTVVDIVDFSGDLDSSTQPKISSTSESVLLDDIMEVVESAAENGTKSDKTDVASMIEKECEVEKITITGAVEESIEQLRRDLELTGTEKASQELCVGNPTSELLFSDTQDTDVFVDSISSDGGVVDDAIEEQLMQFDLLNKSTMKKRALAEDSDDSNSPAKKVRFANEKSVLCEDDSICVQELSVPDEEK